MKFGEIWQKGYFGNFGRPDTKGILVILSRHRNKISRHSEGDLEQNCEIWQKGYFGNFGHPDAKGILVILGVYHVSKIQRAVFLAHHATYRNFSDPKKKIIK